MIKRALILFLMHRNAGHDRFCRGHRFPCVATEEPTVVEDYVEDDGMSEVVGQADQALPSIEGLTPLYTTKIKLMTATGSAASIRVAQDETSQSLGAW